MSLFVPSGSRDPFLAIVARPDVLEPLRTQGPALVRLPQELALAPLSAALCATLAKAHGLSPAVDGFLHLGLASRCCAVLSRSGAVAYVELSRAHGVAASFRDGALAALHAVDVALRELGAVKGSARDELEALGLR